MRLSARCPSRFRVGEHTKPKRGLVDGDREREPLRPRERKLVGLLELAALADEKQNETLHLVCDPRRLGSAHARASGTGTSCGFGRRGVTSKATNTAPRAAAAPIQKAVTKADSAGMFVLPIVSAVRIAAPTWPPITPPTVRMTVFMPVATPVSVGRTESTMIFAMAAKVKGTPPPRTTMPSTICHG